MSTQNAFALAQTDPPPPRIEPGTYWRTRNALDKNHPPGTVLLVTKTLLFEGQVHTVHVANHPEHKTRYAYEWKFIANDFLDLFEFAPDGHAVRQREISAVQQRMTEHQRAASDPFNPDADQTVASDLADWVEAAYGAQPMLPAPDARAALESLLPQLSPDSIETMRRTVKTQSKEIELRNTYVGQKITLLKHEMDILGAYFGEQATAALARTQEIREYANKLIEGVGNLDLYVLTGVQIDTVRDGASAKASVKLSVMQQKLVVMDEMFARSLISSDFDYQNIAEFERLLREDDAFRDQLMPRERCVVAVSLREEPKDYGNPWESAARNQLNLETFLLIRDGERISRVHSSIPSHESAVRLFPTREEYGAVFAGLDGSRITAESVNFVPAMQTLERLQLHYLRFLILLCGLDHHQKLLGDFYPPEATLRFLSLEFQQMYFEFINDDETERMIADGLKPLEELLELAQRSVVAGTPVVLNIAEIGSHHNAPGLYERKRSSSAYGYGSQLKWRVALTDDFPVLPLQLDQHGFFVRVPAERRAYGGLAEQIKGFFGRMDLNKIVRGKPSANYLPLSGISHSDLEPYLTNRHTRNTHRELLPALRRAFIWQRDEERSLGVPKGYPMTRLYHLQSPRSNAKTLQKIQMLEDFARHPTTAQRLIELLEPTFSQPVAIQVIDNEPYAVFTTPPARRFETPIAAWAFVERARIRGYEPSSFTVDAHDANTTWLTLPERGEFTAQRFAPHALLMHKIPAPCNPGDFERVTALVTTAADRVPTVKAAERAGLEPELFSELCEDLQLTCKRGGFVAWRLVHVPIAARIYGDHWDAIQPRLMLLTLTASLEEWMFWASNDAQRSILRSVYSSMFSDDSRGKDLGVNPFAWSVDSREWRAYHSDDAYVVTSGRGYQGSGKLGTWLKAGDGVFHPRTADATFSDTTALAQ